MSALGRWVVPVAAALLCTFGCGLPTTGPVDAGVPGTGILAPAASGQPESTTIYLIGERRLVPVPRTAPGDGGPQQALNLLLAGLMPEDRQKGLVTAVPAGLVAARVTSDSGVIRIDIPTAVPQPTKPAVEQMVCTVTGATPRSKESPGATSVPSPRAVVTISAPGWRLDRLACGAADPAP
ncbi:GerMN domain-containing protein [Uniformispora flossi]|uniref:GerMN domain-containing protein n=1 Tax=Uniformispora flossi TaxID=3390723 RepID=UPI003C2AE704